MIHALEHIQVAIVATLKNVSLEHLPHSYYLVVLAQNHKHYECLVGVTNRQLPRHKKPFKALPS